MKPKPRQMQNVKFRSVGEFLDFIPEGELAIVELLRQIVYDCIPDCVEKLSYNVPTFYRHSRILFIWPASVTWGNVKTNSVRLGFVNGYLMNDEINYLDKGNRKLVFWRDFTAVNEIETDLLKSYIF